MENKCPKCNQKLSVFYLKQDCPKCKVNMVYYNLDKRLEQDAINAAAEVAKWQSIGDGIKNSSFKSAAAIVRFISFFASVLALLLPVYSLPGVANLNPKFSLITFIVSLTSLPDGMGVGDFFSGVVLANSMVLFAALALVLVVLMGLVSLISSLFSFTKNGLVRNIIFQCINLAAFITLSVLACNAGASMLLGSYVVIVFLVLVIPLSFVVNKNLK